MDEGLFDDAQKVLAELRTPLHEPRTVEQLVEKTGIPDVRVRRAISSLRATHGVMTANLRDRSKIAWMLPS